MKDKIYLILTAIAVGLVLFGSVFVLSEAGISNQWLMFIGGSGVYLLATCYVVITDKIIQLKQLKFYEYFVLFLVLTCPLLIAFLLFHFKLVPMPDYLLPYTLFGIVFGPMFVMISEYLLKSRDKKSR